MGATGGASGTGSPVISAITWASDRTPMTSMPGTMAASWACGSGTKIRRIPRCAAASVIGSTPGTARSPPVRVSSPTNTEPPTSAGRSWPSALSTARATARSTWVPRLGRSLGEKRIVTRLVVGQWRPVLWMAMRQRWGASLIDWSVRPTRVRVA